MRGRPTVINKDSLIDTLIKYKDQIVEENQKIVWKHNTIWKTIANEVENHLTPNSLYTFVTCNRYKIREKLTQQVPVREPSPYQEMDINCNVQRISDASSVASKTIESLNKSDKSVINNDILYFTITMAKTDFTSMIIYKTYKRKDKGRPPSTRQYTILQPGTWQQVFSEKIWETTKLSCAFNFKPVKLECDGESGYVYGTCKCGSLIKCAIDNTNEITTKINCKFIKGEGRCGKRYLRNPIRQTIVQKLQGASVMKYRAEMVENLMQSNDNIEPPHLFSANVLRVAKYDVTQANYFDKDPIKALQIMQLGPLQNIIHNIGLNPFFVHYCSNYYIN